MLSLTSLGLIHTAISLVAVGSGALALVWARNIAWSDRTGRVYIIATLLTCLTGFGIFQHGGFGKAHTLGIMTLLILGSAFIAERKSVTSAWASYVAAFCYSTTFFLHMIPGVTETFTRIPLGSPLFSSPEDPALQQFIGVLAGVYLVGVVLQLWYLRRRNGTAGSRTSIA